MARPGAARSPASRIAARRGLAAGIVALALAAGASAESALQVPRPDPLGRFTATIHDRAGRPIGTTEVESREEADGRIHLASRSTVGGRTVHFVETRMEPIGDGATLRPLWQRTGTPIGDGRALARLHVDHERAVATCTLPDEPAFEVTLAPRDHIANAPMLLLLRPISAGRAERVRFRMLMCQGLVRVVGVEARRADGVPGGATEIRYRFDLGPVLSTLLAFLLPDVRVWTRPEPPYAWLGQRMPLPPHAEVVMVRDGVDPAPFLDR